MTTFLKEQISKIYEQHQGHLDEISIIIPNKRAAIYIYKHLSDLNKRPFFPPEVLTIDEWIESETPNRRVNPTELLFIAYDVHREIEKDKADSFDDFIKWAKIILSDFDEIDRYLVEPRKIFKNLRDVKEIENWSFGEEELSGGQEKFMDLWDKLSRYYKLLHQHLEQNDLIYAGKAYRNFAENIDTLELRTHYYFIGFNALSASEELIIRKLTAKQKATAIFDMDEHYVSNPVHEAGHFYRKICREWPIKPELSNYFNTIPKKIEIIETAQQIAQAKIGSDIIRKLLEEGKSMDSTVIVLADENLLIPISGSLPDSLDKANITMGYPIRYSHLKGLVDLIFELQFNYLKFNETKIHHRNFLNILDHPYIQELINKPGKTEELEYDIVQHNSVFLSWNEIVSQLPELKFLDQIFTPWKDPLRDSFTAFNNLIQILFEKLNQKPSDRMLELEIIHHFSQGISKFEQISKTYDNLLNLHSFKYLFYQFWQNEALSFTGNPIEGLQVMGILETRLIGFENVVILGLNEGILPKINIGNSYIPHDLKKFYGLPTQDDRQAIFAHHFYRLIQRANNIWMTYNSTGEALGHTEKSRYIVQLENELDPSTGHRIHHSTYATEDKAAETIDPVYISSELVHQKLDKILDKGLSPSALNKLINCPLDFYYRYILGMKEADGVEENIEVSTFGTNIHKVLERIMKKNFLKDDVKVALSVDILNKEKKNIRQYLKEAYLENFSENDIKIGQNRLSFDVSLRFINEFIDKQIQAINIAKSPIYIEALEENLVAEYQWKINGEIKKVRISGQADRIEQEGNHIRIIDYKSGKCDSDKVKINKSFLSPGGMEDLIHHDKKSYCRQLLMYALMFRQSRTEINTFSAGIISMVNIDEWIQNVYTDDDKSDVLKNEILDEFELELRKKIEALYSPDFEFSHNSKSKFCEHCGG